MFEKFSNYMFSLVHYPLKVLKENSKIYILFKVIGLEYDDIKHKILEVSKQSNINTATDIYLDKLAIDRNMFRFENEEDAGLRKRLVTKAEIMKKSGTKQGIILALNSLGYVVEIEPCYLYDKEHWAEFYVIIIKDIDNNYYKFDIIKNTVIEVKQASSKPNYAYKFIINNPVIEKFIYKLDIIFTVNFWEYIHKKIYYTGQIQYDGLCNYGNYFLSNLSEINLQRLDLKVSFKNHIKNNISVETVSNHKYNAKYLYDEYISYTGGTTKEEL